MKFEKEETRKDQGSKTKSEYESLFDQEY